MHTFVKSTQPREWICPSPHKFLHAPNDVFFWFNLHSPCPANTDLLSVTIMLEKWISYRVYSFSSACLYSVIHVVACVSSALLVTAPEWYSEVCVQCSIFSHCPLVKNLSPSFWLLKTKLLWTFMYNIYMNICFLYTSVNTWGGMTGLYVRCMFKCMENCLTKCFTILYAWGCFPTSSPILGMVILIHFCHSNV